ncbi:serine/threonine-protein kinase, partial [Frankia sp. CcWB2]
HQNLFARTVVIKIINAALGGGDAARRFSRECQAVGRLSHLPEVVSVFGAGTTADGRPFTVMQYLRDGSLAERIRDGGALSVPEAIGVGTRLARALVAAHGAGIIHRDIKPSNLLVTPDGHIVLSDFGTAAIMADPGASASLAVYTPIHCAPEVLNGGQYGTAADVYAFGSPLHTLLAGVAPFAPRPGDGPATILRRILAGNVPELPVNIPPELRSLIRRMMALDLERRPSVTEIVEELDALGRNVGTSALGVSPASSVPLDDTVLSDPEGSLRTASDGSQGAPRARDTSESPTIVHHKVSEGDRAPGRPTDARGLRRGRRLVVPAVVLTVLLLASGAMVGVWRLTAISAGGPATVAPWTPPAHPTLRTPTTSPASPRTAPAMVTAPAPAPAPATVAATPSAAPSPTPAVVPSTTVAESDPPDPPVASPSTVPRFTASQESLYDLLKASVLNRST